MIKTCSLKSYLQLNMDLFKSLSEEEKLGSICGKLKRESD
jgi:hypothetical protein